MRLFDAEVEAYTYQSYFSAQDVQIKVSNAKQHQYHGVPENLQPYNYGIPEMGEYKYFQLRGNKLDK